MVAQPSLPAGAHAGAATLTDPRQGLGRMMTLAVLTAIYLVCELAFNARLLDVVGSAASPDEITAIEKYGRTLSGVAVALVVLQVMMAIRARLGRGSPSNVAILIACALAGGLTYEGLHRLVDTVVKDSSPELRRTSLTLVLLQQALLDGRAEIAGLDEGRELLATAAGKAFLALLPAMALTVENLDQKLHAGKLQLLRVRISANVTARFGQRDRLCASTWRRSFRQRDRRFR